MDPLSLVHIICASLCMLLLLIHAPGEASAESQYKIVCYFAGWSLKRKHVEARTTIDEIDTRMCTHLVYAFASINALNLTLAPGEWDDESSALFKGSYELFNNLKRENRRLRTMLSVGGAHSRSHHFNEVVKTPDTMREFARNAVAYIREWRFDGLDIDWEYPGSHDYGSTPDTSQKFTELIKEIRHAMTEEKRRRLTLSIAVGVAEKLIDKSYEVKKLSKYVDFFNVMAYDFHGNWGKYTAFNSPLFSRTSVNRRFDYRLSQEWAIKRWIKAGAPRRKLVLGMAAEGKIFTLNDIADHHVGAAAVGSDEMAPYTGEKGRLAYYEVCEFLESGAQRKWDRVQKVPYAYKDKKWVGFDNPRSVAIKTAWLKHLKLGGAMIWSLDLDDFSGRHCKSGRYPITRSIHRILQGGSVASGDFNAPSGSTVTYSILSHHSLIILQLTVYTIAYLRFV